MYARVWRFNVLSENVERFAAACRAVGVVNRTHSGFRGFVVVRGGPRDAPECTVVSVWDSLEALRASEGPLFQKLVARALACCKPGTVLQEEDVLICEFASAKKTSSKRKARKTKARRTKTKRTKARRR